MALRLAIYQRKGELGDFGYAPQTPGRLIKKYILGLEARKAVNNNGADQSAHPYSLIKTFVIHLLESLYQCLLLTKVEYLSYHRDDSSDSRGAEDRLIFCII